MVEVRVPQVLAMLDPQRSLISTHATVSISSFSFAQLKYVLMRFGFLITAIGPALDERVEWVETKKTPEEIERVMHQRQVLRIARGSGFGRERSAAGA